MEAAEFTLALIMAILGIALLVFNIFFIYWTVKFLNDTPANLDRIATALEKIANKK
jgi:uncharacterized membrane protein